MAVIRFRFLTSLFIIGVLTFSALGQNKDVISVTYNSNQSIRELAKTYLDDPNAWEILVRFNGYDSPNDIKSGAILKIPVRLYTTLMQRLDESQQLIAQANKEGAGILASKELNQAIDLREQAITLKEQGKLEKALETTNQAKDVSQKALDVAKKKRIQSVSAVLDYKKGTVQTRTPVQSTWNGAEEKDDLTEKERVRTLSNSLGGILFVDGSRLNLNDNSLAVIEAMKQDLIKNTRTSKVTVMEGDVSAFLSSLSQKNEVNVSVPGVQTKIRSKKFTASRDENKVSRFANYDGEIDLTASGKTVTIKENEGSTIAEGQAPSSPEKLLPPPEIVSPKPEQNYYTESASFAWNAVSEAQAYRIEIAGNKSFSRILENIRVAGTQSYSWEAPGNGVYYFRISAVDNKKLKGPSSDQVEFYVNVDTIPPYLAVQSPPDQYISDIPAITLSGTAEQGAILTVKGDTIPVKKDGTFNQSLTLPAGKQKIVLVAKDPAGNVTKVTRVVTVSISDQLVQLNNPGKRIVNSGDVEITGTVKPGVNVTIDGKTATIQNGKLHEILTLTEGEHHLTVVATGADGKSQTNTLDVIVDKTPPVIKLNDVPGYTKNSSLTIQGDLSEKASVRVGEKQISSSGEHFEADVPLQEGKNVLTLVATDDAGNQASNEIAVIRDTQPPKIISRTLSPKQVTAGGVVTIEVKASDSGVGLARTGKFVLQVGDAAQKYQGMLNLASSRDKYTGSVFLPPSAKGQITVISLEITDYLGNQATH